MSIRTLTRSVTFMRPFILSEFDAPRSAGAYQIETDEEQIEGLSFDAFRRVGTRINVPNGPGVMESITVDPDELEAALARDRLAE